MRVVLGAALLSYIILLSTAGFLGLAVHPLAGAVVVLTVTPLLHLFFRRPRYALATLPALLAALAWVLYREPRHLFACLELLARTAHALAQALAGVPTVFGTGELWTLVAALSTALAIVFLLSSYRPRGLFWAIVAGCSLLGLEWALYYDPALSYTGLFLVAGWAHVSWLRSRATTPALVIWPLAGLLAVALLSAILPGDYGPRGPGKALEEIIEVTGMRGSGKDTRGAFALDQVGFGGPPEDLGGPARPSRGVALTVSLRLRDQRAPAPYPGAYPLYLRGTVFSHYTGRGWAAAARRATPPAGSEGRLEQEIRLVDLRTTTLFAVYRPVAFDGVEPLWGPAATARAGRWPGGYTVLTAPTSDEGPSPEYLQLPNDLPRRVLDLAERVTAEHSTPLQRALALQAYLKTIPYDLSVPRAPAGRDFVDYFLFDLRRGYCTYHSSALAVMLRAVGIPSRWVQGFRAEAPPDGTPVEVPFSSAHSWVEAYIPGRGWVTLDPTPGFEAPPLWAPTVEDDAGQALPPSPAPLQKASPLAELTAYDGEEVPAAARRALYPPWLPLAAAPPAALVMVPLLGTAITGLYRRRMLAASGGRAYLAAYAYAAFLLTAFGLLREPHETALEHALRMARHLPRFRGLFLRLAEAYAAVRYGQEEPAGPFGEVYRDLMDLEAHFLRLYGRLKFSLLVLGAWLGLWLRRRARQPEP